LSPVKDTADDRRARSSETSVSQTHSLTALLGGRYRVHGILGRGGLGTVYAAYDLELEREVAIRRLRTDGELDRATLIRDAAGLALVRHPNVVTIHGLHAEPGDAPFFVMEKIEGESLARLLARGRPELRTCLRILSEIAAGLDAIHDAGLVHGDVKPANVLLDSALHVKVADLGVLALLDRMRRGEVVGTAEYLAPERALGAWPDSRLASRGDVYSFGVLAVELLTGRLPYDAESPAQWLFAHVGTSPHRPSKISRLTRAFDAPLLAALEKNPWKRPAKASHVARGLANAALGAAADGSTLRILVVDDDAAQRDRTSVQIAANMRGAVVELASDGRAALDALVREPTVAVVDLSTPGLSGLEVVQAIRERSPKTRVIMATGFGAGAEHARARTLGIRHFFVKPVDPADLCRAIRELADADA
jgi:serine/threonine-protein kinase